MLGAGRHGGFIPWDDDADMFMLRKDFDRFVKTYKSDKYRLLFKDRSGEEFLATGYVKVSDPNTYVGGAKKKNFGVYVDVFPLDSVPEEPKEQHHFMHKIMSLHNRIHHRQKNDIVSIIKSYRHSLNWWMNKMDETIYNSLYEESPLVAHVVGTTNYRTVIRKDRFETLTDIPFEG